jgi:acetyltransferase
MDNEFDIVELEHVDRDTVLDDLIALLQDAVESGASVGFLAPLGREMAAQYWREQVEEVARAKRIILVARKQGRIVGSVQLALASQQNGSHRGEVQRLIVLQAESGQGIGSALMRQLENVARRFGRTLLVLNTRAGYPPESFYCRLGYTLVGQIPGYAQNPDGSFNNTSIMYRHLD